VKRNKGGREGGREGGVGTFFWFWGRCAGGLGGGVGVGVDVDAVGVGFFFGWWCFSVLGDVYNTSLSLSLSAY